MTKLLPQSELDDLASIELTDDFIAQNVDRPFNADYARATLNGTTEQFVRYFLVDQGDSIARLHRSLKDCASVLGDMEGVLQQFISQLGSIQQDIGDVRGVLAETAVQLSNTRATERVLWSAVSCLVVPPEVVQVVTQSSEEQLGPQFMLCVKEMLKYLNYRKGTWRQTMAAAQRDRERPSLSRVGKRDANQAAATNGGVSSRRDSAASGADDEADTLREVRFSLAECRVYYDLMSILDALTLYACIKIKTFLSKKLTILTMKNTNVCIQQDHVLKQYAFYVHFLRAAVPLLRHVYSAPLSQPSAAGSGGSAESATPSGGGFYSSNSPQTGGTLRTDRNGAPSSNAATTLIPYRIARALYEELKREYCVIVSNIYLQKIQDYAFFCNSMEYSTESTYGNTGASVRNGNANFWGFGGAATAAPSPPWGGGGGVGRSSESGPNYAYQLPLITDTTGGGAFLAMRLGEREAILKRVFAPPLIPTMERAARRKHTYEETFRSILSLTCDIVSHEYLFTFDFFSGDMSVYVAVFKPTVQFIVDYLSEVVLVNSVGETRRMLNERPHTSVNSKAKQDTYGLFILIRLCQEFRSMMKHTRKLSCLDGFLDSLLVLLWPPFNACYERQLNALMSAKNEKAMLQCMNHLKRTEDKLGFVHPLVKSFAEFSCVLMSMSYGATMGEQARAAASVQSVERRHRALRQRQDSTPTDDVADGEGDLPSLSSSSDRPRTAGEGHAVLSSQVGSVEWCSAMRQQALVKIDEEHESDAADSRSHFLTLMGDVGFMRIEISHFVVQMGHDIVAAEPNPQRRTQLKPLSTAFALNNIFYLLQVSARYPIILSVDDVAELASAQQHEDGTTGYGNAKALPENVVTLDQRDDFNGVKELFSRLRGEFVENVICHFLGSFLHVVLNAEECSPLEVLQTAEGFVLNWKSALDLVRQTVQALISDPANAQETTAQVCMDVLLYNTRFHAIVAKFLEVGLKAPADDGAKNPFQGRSLRSLIVTNQLLLQHMRTFSVPLAF